MNKRYDQKCDKCPECAFYRPAGRRPESTVDPDLEWDEACGRYGYTLHGDLPSVPDCDGFMTDLQLAAVAKMRIKINGK